MHHTTDMMAHTMASVTPVVEHWLEPEAGYDGVLYREQVADHYNAGGLVI